MQPAGVWESSAGGDSETDLHIGSVGPPGLIPMRSFAVQTRFEVQHGRFLFRVSHGAEMHRKNASVPPGQRHYYPILADPPLI